MEKYILYVGILSAMLGYGAKAAEGHLFSFGGGQDIRAESREGQAAAQEGKVYKRLGEKKYLVWDGVRVTMLDMECFAEGQAACWELVERIEKEATEILRKTEESSTSKEKQDES